MTSRLKYLGVEIRKKSHTLETRTRLSNIRKKYLLENLGKHPWKRHSKFKSIPCEALKTYLLNNEVALEAEFPAAVSIGKYYSIDIAFPDKFVGIEVNGNQHYNRDGTLKPYYENRRIILESLGWTLHQLHYSLCYNPSIIESLLSRITSSPIIKKFNYHTHSYEWAAAYNCIKYRGYSLPSLTDGVIWAILPLYFILEMVPPMGFEPMIFSVKGSYPEPLDDGGVRNFLRAMNATKHTLVNITPYVCGSGIIRPSIVISPYCWYNKNPLGFQSANLTFPVVEFVFLTTTCIVLSPSLKSAFWFIPQLTKQTWLTLSHAFGADAANVLWLVLMSPLPINMSSSILYVNRIKLSVRFAFYCGFAVTR